MASYADLWTFAGVTAIKYMGGPSVAWSPGRSDSPTPTTVPDGECLGLTCSICTFRFVHCSAVEIDVDVRGPGLAELSIMCTLPNVLVKYVANNEITQS